MGALFQLILSILSILSFIILAHVILSLLLNFGIVNRHQQLVSVIARSLEQIAEPILSPFRQFLWRIYPNMGGLDLSPILAFLAIEFIRNLVIEYFPRGGGF